MRSAIILAGGKGQRMHPYTSDKPKSMVSILGNPLISYQLQLLKGAGVSDVVICCGYKYELIKDYIGDGSSHNIQVEYLIEDSPLGRGGALKAAMRRLGTLNTPVLALNGDIITNVNLNEFVSVHNMSGLKATLLAVPLKSPYGIVECQDNGKATRFTEKPELPYWINGGFYVLNPDVEALLPERGDHEDTTFPQLASRGELGVHKSKALWQSVDTIKDLNEVRAHMERFVFSNFFQIGSTTVSTI